ncbi:hypothetical protein DOM21_05200 [Bacteriovorax stolpii]|uniref:Uncharacterized protein n=1 Tax=Bacteriovorax stolpii TaxID=960 RepID=A0A2K9NUE9_BACTC|nr:hypothetical protein [Bacteriovorax stolpii]AUN99156.1 hypothetical protein C0V70_13800 [Bacteriovorax stolpii]QDK40862.1 hypothetical protein DOM21_05200 [Bacteriovorax stolpii]TDP55309.1 hypothetical protein C8D79_0356 [Bacteriovorax stolpii]
MNTIAVMLGTGLIKKEKKMKISTKSKRERTSRRSRRDVSVEMFLREILGTRLIQLEKKF